MTVKDKKNNVNCQKLAQKELIRQNANHRKILKLLKKHYQDSQCALSYKTPYQLLVATVLSAQCTDERVNKVTPHLFKKYSDPQSMSRASLKQIETLIKSTGFYKNKAKHICSAARRIMIEHKGEVPRTMKELTKLPGVGRKTANVVLGNAFGVPGIVVDTHVTRLSNRLGFAKEKDAVKLEKKLEKVVPKKDWVGFSHWMIQHGRRLCKARKPLCKDCFLDHICPHLNLPINS